MDGLFRLVRPEKEHEKQAMEYLTEFYADKSEAHGACGLERYRDDYDGWLEFLEQDRHRAPGDERVPSETFFLMWRLPRCCHLVRGCTEELVGIINIRLKLNDGLRQLGGNIGYGIRPSKRRMGFGKANLFGALKFCQQRGMKVVLLDCDKENLGSAKIIQALGGKLIEECPFPNKEGATLQRYEIDIDKSINANSAKYDPLFSEYPY